MTWISTWRAAPVLLAVAQFAHGFDGALQPTTQGTASALPTPFQPRGVEVLLGGARLTSGLGNWREGTLRGGVQFGAHLLQGELSSTRRFDTSGTFFGISDTYQINDDWYASVAVGAGDGAFYLPRARLDAFINRKWLQARQLVTSLGFGVYDAPDEHIDRSLTIGAIYYFSAPWILEAGIRFNRSNPGSVDSNQRFLAVTYGRHRESLVVARYAWGSEGYQAISAASSLVGFDSREFSLSWRYWMNAHWGLLAGAEHYRNPLYHRTGARFGAFYEF